jgi:hypothetical protein
MVLSGIDAALRMGSKAFLNAVSWLICDAYCVLKIPRFADY